MAISEKIKFVFSTAFDLTKLPDLCLESAAVPFWELLSILIIYGDYFDSLQICSCSLFSFFEESICCVTSDASLLDSSIKIYLSDSLISFFGGISIFYSTTYFSLAISSPVVWVVWNSLILLAVYNKIFYEPSWFSKVSTGREDNFGISYSVLTVVL